MKKRVAAAVLGIMLSVSMGLEVPAAALDSGFESGFTSEPVSYTHLTRGHPGYGTLSGFRSD